MDGIRHGEHFYIEQPAGDPTTVVIAHRAGGAAYLRTNADGTRENTLVALPELPDV